MALNWAERVKLAEEDLARAEAEDAIWQKSPEKCELDEAREREEAVVALCILVPVRLLQWWIAHV